MSVESPALFWRHAFESSDLSIQSPALFSSHVFESPDMPFESPALIFRCVFLNEPTTKHEKLPSMRRVISDLVDIHAALSLYWVQSCTGSIHGSSCQQLVNHLLSLSEHSFFAKDLS